MNLSRFFVQTEAQGTLTPGAPLVRGNNQVGLPARRTNMPNTTKVVNIKLENLKEWFDYLGDMGMESGGILNSSFSINLDIAQPVTFGRTAGTQAHAEAIPSGFGGMRISNDIRDTDSGYGRHVVSPDGDSVYFNAIHGFSFRVTPNEYGMEYNSPSANAIQIGPPTMVSYFYFDDNVDGGFASQAVNRPNPITASNKSIIIYPNGNGTYDDWGTLELTIFGA